MYIPEQGDIIEIDFDPSAGQEIMKRRPAFVLSRQQFNDHTRFAIVAPVTSTVRGIALEVELPTDAKTHGSILVHQMRSQIGRASCRERGERAGGDGSGDTTTRRVRER